MSTRRTARRRAVPPPRDELAALKDAFQFIADARRGYLTVLSRLSPADLRKDRGASFPSILDIFAHVLDAYSFWLEYAYRDRISQRTRHFDTDPQVTFAVVEKEERRVHALVARFLRSLSSSDLEREFSFRYVNEDQMVETRMKVRTMLWHLVEEELQHRGEVNALLWQMEVEPPILGWDDWARTPRTSRRGP